MATSVSHRDRNPPRARFNQGRARDWSHLAGVPSSGTARDGAAVLASLRAAAGSQAPAFGRCGRPTAGAAFWWGCWAAIARVVEPGFARRRAASLSRWEYARAGRLAAARTCRKYAEAFALVASGALKVVALAFDVAAGGDPNRRVEPRIELAPTRSELASKSASEPSRPAVQPRIEPLSEDRYGVHFTADTEFRDLLESEALVFGGS